MDVVNGKEAFFCYQIMQLIRIQAWLQDRRGEWQGGRADNEGKWV